MILQSSLLAGRFDFEISISHVKNGLIEVNYDGRSNHEVLKDLLRMNFVSSFSQTILRRADAISAGKYKFAVIRRDEFEEKDLSHGSISSRATRFGYVPPRSAIMAGLLRLVMPDDVLRGMGLRQLFVMHEPVLSPEGEGCYLGFGYDNMPNRFAAYPSPLRFPSGCGFAYEVPLRHLYPDMDPEIYSRMKAA